MSKEAYNKGFKKGYKKGYDKSTEDKQTVIVVVGIIIVIIFWIGLFSMIAFVGEKLESKYNITDECLERKEKKLSEKIQNHSQNDTSVYNKVNKHDYMSCEENIFIARNFVINETQTLMSKCGKETFKLYLWNEEENQFEIIYKH